jgi:hypothetical protein
LRIAIDSSLRALYPCFFLSAIIFSFFDYYIRQRGHIQAPNESLYAAH